ncbi:MarR family winged helix-turn-helix transcriptional regulator [Enterococcus sp. AZ126]|uniref:MarR family winged helix-turn-helix transcriptional regulator n=1 Tax=Enterococcus sp. AZ126 TaxID=2774635 RepID=UPI003F22135C
MISDRDSLAETVYILSILQQNYVVSKLKTLQLNSIQARSLSYISIHPGTIQRDVADYLGKKQATITNILKGLEERQLVYREIPKDNERQKNIFLTNEGKQVVDQVHLLFEKLDEKFRKGLTNEEQKQLKTILAKAEKNFKEK